jgi:metallophosphoesterase superfamily enzyme
MLLPPYDTLATLTVLSAVITRYDPKLVVSLGDNFHDRVGSAHLPETFRTLIGHGTRARVDLDQRQPRS